MKQTAAAAFISLSVLALLAVGGFLLIQNGFSHEDETPAPIRATENSAPQPAAAPASQEEFAGSSKSPVQLSGDMSDYEMQLYLHEMTHNKVYADVKFGSRPLTADSVAKLIEIVLANSYQDEKFYLETLSAWQEGNFSNAVDVHNTIWSWHGGTIGKATRLMTDQEEQEYANTRH